jgi:dihydroxyacetone kinase-like protein
MSTQLTRRLIDAAVNAIEANTELLTSLDQAIGDGDHGLNMKRLCCDSAQTSLRPGVGALGKRLLLVTKVGGGPARSMATC